MAIPQPRSFGELLRRYRTAAGLTQEDLAEQAGLSARAIGALENGTRRTPRKETVALIAGALHLSPAERALLLSAARQRLASVTPSDEPLAAVATRTLIPHRPGSPLVGRQRERLALARHLAGEGPPLLMLAGEPGIGKSRLLEESARLAAEQGWMVLAGGCHRRGERDSYAPFVSALTRFLAIRSPAQQRQDLHGCTWLMRLLPELAESAIVPSPSWTLPAEQERRLMFGAVARLLANVAGPAGTVLLLDDLQWAGADVLDLLASLLREPGPHPVRVVAAFRDTDVDPRAPLAQLLGDLSREDLATQTSLAPLARDEARDLLVKLLAGEPASQQEELVDAVLDRAEGLPLFLVSWAQELRLAPRSAAPAPGAVPWSAAESIRQRIVVLPDAARAVLSLAAVVGREASRRVLFAASAQVGQSEADVLAGLEAACRARLLAESEAGTYVFAHDLIRETLLADLGGAQRAVFHRGVAGALETLPPRERAHRAAELAGHLLRTDAPERALPYLIQAGDHAASAYAPTEAQQHFTHALDLAREVGDEQHEALASERRADMRYLLGHLDDAYSDLARATRIYRATQNWERLAWATCQQAKVCDPLDRVAESMRLLDDLLVALGQAASQAASQAEPAPRVDETTMRNGAPPTSPATLQARAEHAVTLLSDRTAAYLFHALAARLVFLGQLDEAIALTPAAVTHAQHAGDQRIESLDATFCAMALCQVGRLDDAQTWFTDAVRLAKACGDLEAHYFALANLAAVHELHAEPHAARAALLGALESVTQLGDLGAKSEVLYLLGNNAFVLGQWREARTHFHAAIATIPPSPSPYPVPQLAELALACLDLIAGRNSIVQTRFEESALPGHFSHGPEISRPVLEMLCEAHLLTGDAQAVRDRLRALSGMRRDGGGNPTLPSFDESVLLALRAEAEITLGDFTTARDTLNQAHQQAHFHQNRAAAATIGRAEALAALRQGQWDEAEAALDRTLTLCRAMPYPYAEAKALAVYAQLHQARGETDRARASYEQARALLHRLGERLCAALIERTLAALA